MPLLLDEFDSVYVSNIAKFERDVEVGRHSEDQLKYCILPWLHYTLQFLHVSKVWRNATESKRRYWTAFEGPCFVVWHYRVFFFLLPVKQSRLYAAITSS